ncbi:sensor domain-containing diguanylate cyclase [Ruminococcus sp.]|uniref:sensor domain-containing diguanylate cyclase n=1 Tax=Ruminococcus sp. TaxID=41978 RepID=UPI0025EFD0A5|nr:sensor domain-containing diguanylate cyclase [Ruminococcus sp.]MBQ8966628.1 diguanylate cyclase [Ruminococcus sp.]
MEKKKQDNGNIVVVVICAVLYIAAFIVQTRGISGLSPILAQAQVVISIIMTMFGKKKGMITGVALNAITTLMALLRALRSVKTDEFSVSDLAGAAVAFISIGIVLLIYFYVNKSDRMTAELQESYQEAIEKNRIIEQQGKSVQFLAYYDQLTGMPNRQSFMDELEKQIKEKGDCVAIYVDMDDFRRINDNYGHAIGDELLKRYADKIKDYCSDNSFAAKIGGDEFGIILTGSKTQEAIFQYAAGISKIFSEPIEIGGNIYTVAASYGAASFPENAMTADDLFRCAESAMFIAKESGKNQLCFYTRQG